MSKEDRDRDSNEETERRTRDWSTPKRREGQSRLASMTFKGRKKSDEARKRMSESKMGEKNPNYGKHFDDAHKNKIKQWWTPERREWMRNLARGRERSEEVRRKLSESLKGRKAWNKGLTQSDETKKKISSALRGRRGFHPTEETRRKHSESMKRLWASDEYKTRMSEAHKGYKMPDETRMKLSKSLRLHHQREKVLQQRGPSGWKAIAERTYFVANSGIGETDQTRPETSQEVETRRSEESEYSISIGKCMVCMFDIKDSEETICCPRCGLISHKAHFLERLRVEHRCPACNERMNEERLSN